MQELYQNNLNYFRIDLKQLQKHFKFTYLNSLSFKDDNVKNILFTEGNESFKKEEVLKAHLEKGALFKEKIEKGALACVSIRYVAKEVGYGLFAEEDLPYRSFIGEYVGIVRKNDDHIHQSNYLYSYPVLDEIGRNYVIDAFNGNLTRFINHSYTPNLQTGFAFVGGFYHMVLTANRPIAKGEQLSFNYGKNYWYTRERPLTL